MTTSTDIRTFVGASTDEVAARRAATRLRNWLRTNAAFSFVTGTIALAGADPVARRLGVAADIGIADVWLVRLLAGGLVGFAVVVFVVSGLTTSALLRWSRPISIADLGWVAATAAVVVAGWLSTGGTLLAGAVGLVVLELAMLQLRSARRLRRAIAATDADLGESPPVEILQTSASAPHSAEQLWPVMTDHELYARLALNLRGAEALTPNGPGLRRVCTDPLGRTWSETCTLWEPGRRFDVDVDTGDYPYPLAVVQGSWHVQPTDESSSTISMTFAVQPRPGVAGRLFVPFMHLVFRPILRRIISGWTRAASMSR